MEVFSRIFWEQNHVTVGKTLKLLKQTVFSRDVWFEVVWYKEWNIFVWQAEKNCDVLTQIMFDN